MIIQILLLTMGLDMSRPEFEPTTDVSGDYVVGTYDVSSDDFIVEELEDVPVDVTPSVDDSLSTSPVRGEQLYVSGNDDVVSAIQSLQEDNNAYWELFLDSYPIYVTHSLSSTFLLNNQWRFNGSGGVEPIGSSTFHISYVPVSVGNTYTITDLQKPSYNYYWFAVVDNIDYPTSVTNFYSQPLDDFSSTYTFSPSQNGYFVVTIFHSMQPDFVCTWVTEERESYTLSELGNAVVEIGDVVSRLRETLRAILLFVLITFAYPIALAIVKNIVGGDK